MNLKKKLVLDIEQDEHGESPREWDNLGAMLTWEDRYSSPDKNTFSSFRDWVACHCGAISEELMYEANNSVHGYFTAVQKKLHHYGMIALPVYKFEHSGVAYNTKGFSCPWDSGLVGLIFVEKDKVYKEYGCKKVTKKILDKVREVLSGEVETYSQWANGEVYMYQMETLDGDFVDSCGGYYGESEEEMMNDVIKQDDSYGIVADWEEYDEEIIRSKFRLVAI